MQDALVNLLAWRLDVAHIDPLSTVVYTLGWEPEVQGRQARHPARDLRAPRHRPERMPRERRVRAAARRSPSALRLTGLPKLYVPTVVGVLGGHVRFQGRVSSALPWTVTITDALGKTVASGSGRGPLVDWTWNSVVAGKGIFTWTIAAPGARPATGTIGISRGLPPPPALSLRNLAASPAVLAPGTDGSGDGSTVTFTLGAPSTVTARLQDAGGATVQTLLDEKLAAGANSFSWAADRAAGRPLPAARDRRRRRETRHEDGCGRRSTGR